MTAPAPGMQIMMTADAVGGVWSYATALACELGRRGHAVHLIVLGPEPSAAQRESLAQAPGVTLETPGLALEWADPAGEDMARAQSCLAQIARRIRPDIVHLNGYREAGYAWEAPVVVAAHSDVRSWWRTCRGGDPDEPRWWTYIENVRRGLAAADEWVAPSAAFRNEVRDLYAPPRAGHVIHNGVAPAQLGEHPSKEPFVLAAGRLWDEAKNMDALLSAVSPERWPIVVAGETRSAADGSALAAHEKQGATFTGALSHPELLATMGRAEVFVSPAVYEPFGLAVLEAAAAGCALVLSDIPSFRELWDGAATFVDPGDPATIGGALARLQDDGLLRRRLGNAARHRARRYTLDGMADAYAALYATMAGRGLFPAARSRPALLEAAR